MARSAVDEIFRIKELIGDHVSQRVRALLETKHLYQRVDLGLQSLVATELSSFDHQMKVSVGSEVTRALSQPWMVSHVRIAPAEELPAPIYFAVELAKLYCGRCERVEAFKCVFAADILRPHFAFYSHIRHPDATTAQTFVFTFACQACGSAVVPETFLIERKGQHIAQCGRAPIEQLPPFDGIPKDEQRLLQNARVARNSGQALGAIALLRCFLEQYARQRTQSREVGDRLMAAYHTSLPDTFPSEFRVFTSLYSTLSEAQHNANASSDVFDEALDALRDHFRARQLYRVK